jgi:hypothetical protein
MADFPANPSSGEIFEGISGVYRWDGTKWTLLEQPEEIGIPWLVSIVSNSMGSYGVKAIPPMFDASAYLSPPLMMEQIWNEISTGGSGGTGPPGPQGPMGPPGPTAVSTDANNDARLGSDNLIFVPIPPGGGGLPEAPIDGNAYGRSDAAWLQVLKTTGDIFDGGNF